MTSRTYRTCERIMEAVVKGRYLSQIGIFDLKLFIKKIAGGDKRTVDAYLQHLVDFKFLEPFAPSIEARLKDIRAKKIHLFKINLMMLPYAQTRLDELIQASKVVEVKE